MSDDSQTPTPESLSDEPTVLDLYKSVFKDWKSFFNFLASAFDAARREQLNRSLAEEREVIVEPTPEPAHEPEPASDSSRAGIPFPWRVPLALLLALLAQYMLEPAGKIFVFGSFHLEKSGHNAPVAMFFYVAAFVLLIWGIVRREISLQPLPPDHDRVDPETVKLIPLHSGLLYWQIAG